MEAEPATSRTLCEKTIFRSRPCALRTKSGSSTATKSESLSETFLEKAKLPDPHGEWEPRSLGTEQSGNIEFTLEKTASILKELDPDKATGPDFLPARILKLCALELAPPVKTLAEKMVREGEWPDCWREHWLAPSFEKKDQSQTLTNTEAST